ncbi:SpoIIE family protein phosphatase [Synergistaceae bacterium OttesenSCG-928-I11]|nr:SpoIIE family protein phosphatase [Synergistaceae bacterium OttesenSCG-928-I11]
MKKTGGLTFRILLIVLLGGGFIVAGASGYSYIALQRYSDRIAQDAARRISETVSIRLETASRPIVRRAENFSKYDGLESQWILYSESVESRKLYDHLGATLLDSPYLLSAGLLLDPATWNRTREEVAHAPFVIRSGDTFLLRDLAESGTDYLDSDFFVRTMAEKRSTWVEPMIETEDGTHIAACYAHPLAHGVLLLGVPTEWIAGVMQGISAPFDGTLRILNIEGGEIFRSANPADGDANAVYSNDLSLTGWKLEAIYPARTLTAEARDVAAKIFGIGGIALICTALLAALVTTAVARSLRHLKKNIASLAQASEGFSLPSASVAGTEIEDLTESLEAMHLDAAKRIADAERTLVVRESERKELEIATDLRKKYFASPTLEEARFSVATHLDCSSRLRGVFYDVFPTDRGTLYLAVGEVPGEGTSSTLSLCAVLSFLRAVLSGGPKPNNAILQLGELLSRFGVENRSVSMLLAEFYPSTGTCVLASANYPNAMLVRNGISATIDLPESSKIDAGESDCASTIFNMNKGDAILLYSADLVDGNGKPLSLEQLSVCTAKAVPDKTLCGEALESLVQEISGDSETRAVTGDDVLMLLLYK